MRMEWAHINTGMSLIELLVALVIAGILAAVAVPGYQQHIMKSHRGQVQTQLISSVLSQQSFFLAHQRYADQNALGLKDTEFYHFEVINLSANTFTLVAKAAGKQKNDKGCTTLSLDQSMQKRPETCWK